MRKSVRGQGRVSRWQGGNLAQHSQIRFQLAAELLARRRTGVPGGHEAHASRLLRQFAEQFPSSRSESRIPLCQPDPGRTAGRIVRRCPRPQNLPRLPLVVPAGKSRHRVCWQWRVTQPLGNSGPSPSREPGRRTVLEGSSHVAFPRMQQDMRSTHDSPNATPARREAWSLRNSVKETWLRSTARAILSPNPRLPQTPRHRRHIRPRRERHSAKGP